MIPVPCCDAIYNALCDGVAETSNPFEKIETQKLKSVSGSNSCFFPFLAVAVVVGTMGICCTLFGDSSTPPIPAALSPLLIDKMTCLRLNRVVSLLGLVARFVGCQGYALLVSKAGPVAPRVVVSAKAEVLSESLK